MQISVATYVSDRPIFVQNAQSHPCDLGWLIRPFYFVGVFDLSQSLLDFPRNPPDDTGLVRFGRCCHLSPARHWHWDGVR